MEGGVTCGVGCGAARSPRGPGLLVQERREEVCEDALRVGGRRGVHRHLLHTHTGLMLWLIVLALRLTSGALMHRELLIVQLGPISLILDASSCPFLTNG